MENNDLKYLPQELIDQLKLPREKKLKSSVVLKVVSDAGNDMSINEILIAIYRSTSKILRREIVTTYLSTYVKKGLLIRRKQGIYALPRYWSPAGRGITFEGESVLNILVDSPVACHKGHNDG